MDLEGFLNYIASNIVSRQEGYQLMGRDEITRLIAEGVIVDNPFSQRLEVGRGTEDFYP